MERSRKLTLTDQTKADNALFLHFEGNKSKLATHLKKKSRTTITAFFSQESLSEPEFRKICFALRLNWQEVSAVETIAPTQNENDWIEEVRSRCCQKILYQHGTIRLLNDAEIGVDQLYVDVWLLNRSPRKFQPSSTMLELFDLRNDRLGLGDRIKRNEGMEVATDNARLLILGKPGAGKTTFLKHLAVDCSNGKFQPNLIPILIELRKIQSTEWKLLDAISVELEVDSQRAQKLLERGRLLILADGLDEVPTNSFRRNVQEQLWSLAQEPKHSGSRFILTCRTQIIEVVPQGFKSVEVTDFNPKQVKKFVENWFRASGQTEADIAQQLQAFLDATEANSALKELTVTPVLLSLMCWVFEDSGELPSQATSLYQKGILLLLEEWNDRKEIDGWEIGKEVYRELSIDQKEALLTEIAARKFENPGNFVLFEQKDLAKQIANFLKLANAREGKAVLKAIEAQHGLLVERADELWSFSHLTFQEYFTAKEIVEKADYEKLVGHLADKQWREVFLLTANMTNKTLEANSFMQCMKQKVDALVVEDETIQRFLTWVKEKAASVGASYKPAAIRAFYLALSKEFFSDWNPSSGDRLCFPSGQDISDKFLLAPELDQQLKGALNRESDKEYISELLMDLCQLQSEYEQMYEDWDDYYRYYNVIQTAKSEIETLELKIDNLFDSSNSLSRDLESELHYDLLISDSFFAYLSGEWLDFSDVLLPYSEPYSCYPATPRVQTDPEFRKAMKELLDNIHCSCWSYKDCSWQSPSMKWWRENRQNWINQLRAVLIEHRNIGHNWKFSDVQKETLQQYYDANKLLIDCLNSDRTRQEIEDNLLLPIAELKRRSPDLYS